MLCHEYECIFVHVPKTAGQSVEAFFFEALGIPREERARLLLQKKNRDPSHGPPKLAHLKASEYVRYGYVNEEQFRRYFKFAFVRNPWDRIVSEYRYRKLPYRFDFKTYLFKHLPKPSWTDYYLHVIPQADYLYDDQGQCLVDFVGRYERLEADFKTVSQRLGLGHHSLPHVNKSMTARDWFPRNRHQTGKALYRLVFSYRLLRNQHRHYTEYFDAESRDFVAELYRADIDAFGYQFGQ